jgi:hypothetical protein
MRGGGRGEGGGERGGIKIHQFTLSLTHLNTT